MTTNIKSLWPTILWQKKFGKISQNQTLVEECISEYAKVKAHHKIDYLVNRHNLFENPSPSMHNLSMLVSQQVISMLQSAYEISDPNYQIMAQAQVGLTRKHSHLPLHDHSKNDFAAVYYPQQLPADKGGTLRLFDSRSWKRKFKTNSQKIFNHEWLEIQPEEGLLVIFPGYIPHDVSTWFGEEDRLSINMVINVQTNSSHRLVPISE